MTLQTLRRQVNTRSGVAHSDEALDDLINEALAQVSLVSDWWWLDETAFYDTADGPLITLPDDLRAVRAVTVGNAEATPLSIRDVDAHSTRRFGYVLEGPYLTLYPAPPLAGGPDGAGHDIVIRYTAHENELLDEADVARLPRQWNPVVVALAASWACERAGQTKRARDLHERYEGWIGSMLRQAGRKRGPFRPRIATTSGFG